MRDIKERQLLLQPALPDHSHLSELAEMSKVLDANSIRTIACVLIDGIYSHKDAVLGCELVY